MNRPLRVAAICTAWHARSHADVILQRWMCPRPTDDQYGWTGPRTELVSVYIEQKLENDTGCGLCREHAVPIYDSVDAALTCGTDELAVDGVLLIGEHGEYPDNDLEQKLYPRKELFDQIVATFSRTGRTAAVFCDKHYSWDFHAACDMDRTARKMGFCLFGGSSIPLCPLQPPPDIADQKLKRALTLFYQHDERYGYHSVELAQSIIEQRRGGESGIAAVTVYRGERAWRYLRDDAMVDAVVEAMAALGQAEAGTPLENVKPPLPTVAVFEHVDGLENVHVNFSGHIRGWGTALRLAGTEELVVTVPRVADAELFYAHFAALAGQFEDALLGECPAHLPRRSLLTTGMTAAMMRARQHPGTTVETPELGIAYSRQPDSAPAGSRDIPGP